MKLSKKFILGIISCLSLWYFLLILFNGPSAILSPPQTQSQTQPSHSISLVQHGWHVGLLVPTPLIFKEIPQLKERFPNAQFLEIGWGDRGFYQSKELTWDVYLSAIFWPSASTMHIVGVHEDFESFTQNRTTQKLCLSQVELSQMIKFIRSSFQKDDSKQIQSSVKGLYGDSQFYQGQGRYNWTYTCNRWVAEALKSSGLSLWSQGLLTSQSLMSEVEQQIQSQPSFQYHNCSAQ